MFAQTTKLEFTHILRLTPALILLVYIAAFVWNIPQNDLSESFIPAGDFILSGQSPYIINQTHPFIYWPLTLWIFPVLALVPSAHHILVVINTLLLIVIIRRLHVSLWWCLYPPVLYTIAAGQLDILALWLAVEAFNRCEKPVAAPLIVLSVAIKPQVAIFWLLPWFWSLPNMKKRLYLTMLCASLIAVPLVIWAISVPDTFFGLWSDWLAGIRQHSGAYTGDSPSFWAINWPVAALAMLLLWLYFSRHPNVSRALLALGLPAMRYYSMVVLIGIAPVAIALITGYAAIALTAILGKAVFWIEPLVYLGTLIVTDFRREKNNSLRPDAVGSGSG